jgi:hypothetical protein
MGIVSSLFFSSNDTDRQTLYRRITPSTEQMQEQQGRWNELAERIMADLRADTGCPIRSWLQGSYKYHTQIRPPRRGDEFDIDLGIFVCWPGQADDGPHTPSDLRKALHLSLQAYTASTDAVRSLDNPPSRDAVASTTTATFMSTSRSIISIPTPTSARSLPPEAGRSATPRRFISGLGTNLMMRNARGFVATFAT